MNLCGGKQLVVAHIIGTSTKFSQVNLWCHLNVFGSMKSLTATTKLGSTWIRYILEIRTSFWPLFKTQLLPTLWLSIKNPTIVLSTEMNCLCISDLLRLVPTLHRLLKYIAQEFNSQVWKKNKNDLGILEIYKTIILIMVKNYHDITKL
jgi:hypothetical protein